MAAKKTIKHKQRYCHVGRHWAYIGVFMSTGSRDCSICEGTNKLKEPERYNNKARRYCAGGHVTKIEDFDRHTDGKVRNRCKYCRATPDPTRPHPRNAPVWQEPETVTVTRVVYEPYVHNGVRYERKTLISTTYKSE